MRVYHQKSANRSKEYYAASDYYEGGPEQFKGEWIGCGAERLGLTGEIEQVHFDRLVDNLHPFEDKRLTQRNNANRRVLSDITFSAPKSVSILYGITEDLAIADAVRDAAKETFTDLEKDAQTRVNLKRGEMTFRETGNIVGGLWLHSTSRPEQDEKFGPHADMQLHVHGVVLNATFDESKKRWTAVDLSNVVRDSGYYDAIFMNRLASKIKNLGYAVERSENNFEVSGISRETIEKFSRRTKRINDLIENEKVPEKIAHETGLSLSRAMDQVGAYSRKEKLSDYSLEDLHNVWRDRLSQEESDQIRDVASGMVPAPTKTVSANQAIKFAQDHNFERESVVRERHVLRDALLHGIGDLTTDEVHRTAKNQKWIREGDGATALITTSEILKEEQQLMSFARSGRGSVTSLAPGHVIERDWLSDEQKLAVTELLESTDRVQVLAGRAGVGKTTLMSEAISAIEKKGTNVWRFSRLLQKRPMMFWPKKGSRHTLWRRFCSIKKHRQQARGGVVWVDEAGLAGMQDISKLARIANELDARIILSGDDRQHKSVSRGKPLSLA